MYRPAVAAAFRADLDDPRHGTPNGYVNFRCRCPRCEQAGREYFRKYTHTRARRSCPPSLHGSWNGYTNYRCDCDDCINASRVYRKVQREAARFRD